MSTIKARPTTYNGIAMRSRLEATTAAALDAIGAVWEYEPGAFASVEGQYMPDFLVRDVHIARMLDGRPDSYGDLYVEVRPTRDRVVPACDREASILHASTNATLLYVGWALVPLFGLAIPGDPPGGRKHVAVLADSRRCPWLAADQVVALCDDLADVFLMGAMSERENGGDR